MLRIQGGRDRARRPDSHLGGGCSHETNTSAHHLPPAAGVRRRAPVSPPARRGCPRPTRSDDGRRERLARPPGPGDRGDTPRRRILVTAAKVTRRSTPMPRTTSRTSTCEGVTPTPPRSPHSTVAVSARHEVPKRGAGRRQDVTSPSKLPAFRPDSASGRVTDDSDRCTRADAAARTGSSRKHNQVEIVRVPSAESRAIPRKERTSGEDDGARTRS